MVRTGSLELVPEGGESPKRRLPKRRRQTDWREVRLSVVERPVDGDVIRQGLWSTHRHSH